MLDINQHAFACFVVCSDMGEEKLDLSDSLLAVEVAEPNAAEMSRGVDYLPGEATVEAHFGKSSVDNWAVDV